MTKERNLIKNDKPRIQVVPTYRKVSYRHNLTLNKVRKNRSKTNKRKKERTATCDVFDGSFCGNNSFRKIFPSYMFRKALNTPLGLPKGHLLFPALLKCGFQLCISMRLAWNKGCNSFIYYNTLRMFGRNLANFLLDSEIKSRWKWKNRESNT